jgi:hypothetical protein
LLRKGSVETDDDDTGVVLDAKGNVISREDENLRMMSLMIRLLICPMIMK